MVLIHGNKSKTANVRHFEKVDKLLYPNNGHEMGHDGAYSSFAPKMRIFGNTDDEWPPCWKLLNRHISATLDVIGIGSPGGEALPVGPRRRFKSSSVNWARAVNVVGVKRRSIAQCCMLRRTARHFRPFLHFHNYFRFHKSMSGSTPGNRRKTHVYALVQRVVTLAFQRRVSAFSRYFAPSESKMAVKTTSCSSCGNPFRRFACSFLLWCTSRHFEPISVILQALPVFQFYFRFDT